MSDKHVEIDIEIYEGPRYYFGDIKWSGNAKYSDTILNTVLGLKKGDVFSEEKLITKLYGPSRSGNEISTLYMNDGYLTFNVDPVQTRIYGDTIDMELRIYEGPQYTVSKVTVKGNDVTNDRVILREIVNKPGQKFSKSLVMQTVQQIAQLGNFDETKTNPVPIPNELEGTVDMQYNVVENLLIRLSFQAVSVVIGLSVHSDSPSTTSLLADFLRRERGSPCLVATVRNLVYADKPTVSSISRTASRFQSHGLAERNRFTSV